MVRGIYVSYIYPLLIFTISTGEGRIYTSTFQGKAPPPPVAKGAGKVAKSVGMLEKTWVLFVITEFFVWEKNYYMVLI